MTTTGLEEINFTAKRILGVSDWRDRLFQKILAETRAVAAKTFAAPGVFFDQIDISADGNNKFKLSPFSDATDGEGRLFTPDAELAQGVQFENANTVDYSVGLHFAQRPRGYARNPRTGFPDVQAMEDTIGNQGVPDAVVDDGDGTMTVTVDSVCEAGVSHAGRKVVVWKLSPGLNATSEAEVIETLTVVWNGVNNKVATVGNFGQGATPSTTLADYAITILGPSVRRNTDLSVAAGFAFVGVVTGVGAGSPPTVFSMVGQNIIDSTLSDFNEVTRIDSHGHMKLSVQGDASDSGESQIEVKNHAGAVKFKVDEAGNVVIAGDLLVQGDEIVQNTTTINTTVIVGAQAQLGDADTDSHVVKGTWTHKFGGSTVAFEIDGATGNATFNEVATFNGATNFEGAATFDGTAEVDGNILTVRRVSNINTANPDFSFPGARLSLLDSGAANNLGTPLWFRHLNALASVGHAAFVRRTGAHTAKLVFGFFDNDVYVNDLASLSEDGTLTLAADKVKIPTRTMSIAVPFVPHLVGALATVTPAVGGSQTHNQLDFAGVTGSIDAAFVSFLLPAPPTRASIASVTVTYDLTAVADGANTKLKASIAGDPSHSSNNLDGVTTAVSGAFPGSTGDDHSLVVAFAAPHVVAAGTGGLFLFLQINHTGGGTASATMLIHSINVTYTLDQL